MKETDGCAIPSTVSSSPWENPKLTIGQACDLRIEQARVQVQRLCIHKAKLEVLNMLDMSHHELQQMLNGY